MKTSTQRMSARWGRLALCIMVALILVACGRNEPTPEPTATAPEAPAEEVTEEVTDEPAAAEEAQAESPLSQPESPLSQPESPLTTTLMVPRTEADALALAEITNALEPSAGMASIAGVVYSFGTVPGAIRGTQVYLEEADEVDGEFFPPSVSLGPSVAEGDIIVETNDYGQLFMEVPPGSYYPAVWTIYDWRLMVDAVGEESPRLITIEEGDQLDLGVLYAYWP
jgi:hypothetical protein